MIEPGVASSEVAWSKLVGPGAPIDTNKYFVVCSNMLGSSYGSANAASIDRRFGRPYGSAFPNISVADIVLAQKRSFKHLGVTHLHARLCIGTPSACLPPADRCAMAPGVRRDGTRGCRR